MPKNALKPKKAQKYKKSKSQYYNFEPDIVWAEFTAVYVLNIVKTKIMRNPKKSL